MDGLSEREIKTAGSSADQRNVLGLSKRDLPPRWPGCMTGGCLMSDCYIFLGHTGRQTIGKGWSCLGIVSVCVLGSPNGSFSYEKRIIVCDMGGPTWLTFHDSAGT